MRQKMPELTLHECDHVKAIFEKHPRLRDYSFIDLVKIGVEMEMSDDKELFNDVCKLLDHYYPIEALSEHLKNNE